MLIMSRRQGESIQVGHGLQVTVNALNTERVQLVLERTREDLARKLLRKAITSIVLPMNRRFRKFIP